MKFGKYELGPLIAQGGMAEVYAARLHGAEGFVKTVAIKRILPHFTTDPEFVSLFINEARLAAQLQHANIVQIHDFDEAEGLYYIAMELVQGRDLRRVLNRAAERGSRMSLDLALHVGMEVLKGLAAAHGLRDPEGNPVGLVHRDLSPHNILLSYAGEVKVTDFGIAKAVGPVQSLATTSSVIRGKLPYMSPEQVAGAPVDRRSDLFAAGLILFELVTGRRRYDPELEDALILQVAKAELPDPKTYNAAVSPRLAGVLQTLLATAPEDRFDDARAALAALRDSGGAVDRTLELAAFMRDLFPDEAGQGSLSAVYFSSGSTGGEESGRPASFRSTEPGGDPETVARDPVERDDLLGEDTGGGGVPVEPMGGASLQSQRREGPLRVRTPAPSGAGIATEGAPVGQARRIARAGLWAAPVLLAAGVLGFYGAGWLDVSRSGADSAAIDGAAQRDSGGRTGETARSGPAGASVLAVRSSPSGAQVLVDGLPTGRQTPARFGIRSGVHEIVVRWPDGRQRRVTRVLSAGGVHEVRLHAPPGLFRAPSGRPRRIRGPRRRGPSARSASSISTRRASALARSSPPARSISPRGITWASGLRAVAEAPPRRSPPRRAPSRPSALGGRASVVEFACRPWAMVRLGGRALGQTPQRRVLRPGRYRVIFENASLALRVRRTVHVRGDGAHRVVRCH